MSARIIGITGTAGSGKDSIARMLTASHVVNFGSSTNYTLVDVRPDVPTEVPEKFYTSRLDWVQACLADPMKVAVMRWFDWDIQRLWGPSAARNEPDPRYGGLSARVALQTLGTEFGRKCYPNVWLDQLLKLVNQLGSISASLFAVPDVRFDNEAAAIRDCGGEIWHVRRQRAGLSGAAASHTSEAGISSKYVTHTIDNNATNGFDDLYQAVVALRDQQ